MGFLSGLFNSPQDDWYERQAMAKNHPDADVREIAAKMDRCPNNPRNGGPGHFYNRRDLDRR